MEEIKATQSDEDWLQDYDNEKMTKEAMERINWASNSWQEMKNRTPW